jgi:hypothetical protein
MNTTKILMAFACGMCLLSATTLASTAPIASRASDYETVPGILKRARSEPALSLMWKIMTVRSSAVMKQVQRQKADIAIIFCTLMLVASRAKPDDHKEGYPPVT